MNQPTTKAPLQVLICELCQQSYEMPSSQRSYQGLCPSHWSKDTLREWDRLDSARRHLQPGRPNTLTLLEWLGIVTAYRGMCALCEMNRMDALAIWIPASGLQAGNVAPLCRVCHYHKEHSFLSAMDRVSAQLESYH